MKAMKVLLLSPLRGMDPPNGDVSYSEALLAKPPEGVTYTTYTEALERGELFEHGRRTAITRAPAGDRNRLIRELGLLVTQRCVNALRKRSWLFREPHRFFSVKPGTFDLVHVHVFNCRFLRCDCPVVMSSGAPLPDVYQAVWRYAPRKMAALSSRELRLAKLFGTNTNSFYLPQVDRLIVWTEHCQQDYLRRQLIAPDKIDLVPSFLPTEGHAIRRHSQVPRRIGFVAKNFTAKGGDVLLRAFEHVRQKRPDAELTVVGSPSSGWSQEEWRQRGVQWVGLIPRQQLLEDVMPTFDVFAYPTEFDCISYVTLEVMSKGIPVAVSDYPSMPEVVAYGKAGLVSAVGDAHALAANILQLLDPTVNQTYSQAAIERFQNHYSAQAVLPRLRASYDQAVSSRAQKKGAFVAT